MKRTEYENEVELWVSALDPVHWPGADPSVDFPDLDITKWDALFDAENSLVCICPKSKMRAVAAALNLNVETGD